MEVMRITHLNNNGKIIELQDRTGNKIIMSHYNGTWSIRISNSQKGVLLYMTPEVSYLNPSGVPKSVLEISELLETAKKTGTIKLLFSNYSLKKLEKILKEV